MRLSKLKLAGFKTFVDPSIILTPGNLVGVVGPNGCGKSNVIDAVRWVLGEMRASALRGESMQDVIFNGSVARKAVSRASVEMVFDNSEGKAAGQWSRYGEISVKRVLERSGDSAYFINGIQVRRKDVIDLFLGTGLGPRAYAIIEQGMISRIIEARPEQIRGFLEEAAGVSKYRERRRETEGRLADARDNLHRLEDIRLELGERIDHLEEQAKVATRFQTLQAQHQQSQQLLWMLKLTTAQQQQQTLEADLAELSMHLERNSANLQELGNAIDRARSAHTAAVESTQLAQTDSFAAAAEVSRLENEIRHQQETLSRLETRIEEFVREHEHWQTRQQSLESEHSRWQGLAENASMRLVQCEVQHQEICARLPEVEAAFRLGEAKLQALRNELAQTEQQQRVEQTQHDNAARALSALALRRERLESEHNQLLAPDELLLAVAEERLEQQQQGLIAQQQELEQLQLHHAEAQTVLGQARGAEKTLQDALTAVGARHDALLQLQQRVQTHGKLGEWLQRHQLDGLAPLWQSLRVQAGWEQALAAILRERLRALVGADVRAAATFLSDPPDESLVLLLDASTQASPLLLPSPPLGSLSALSCIEIEDERLRPALERALGNFFVVTTLTPWLERRTELAEGVYLVAADGSLLSRHDVARFSGDDRTEGVMERQRELEALLAQREDLALQVESALENVHKAANEAESLIQRKASLRHALQLGQQQLHGAQIELLKQQQARQRVHERKLQLQQDLEELQRQLNKEQEHLTRANLENERCMSLAALQCDQLEVVQEAFAEQDQALRDIRKQEQAAKHDKQEAVFSERECQTKLNDIATNLRLAGEQLTRLEAALAQCRQERSEQGNSDHLAALQQALMLRESREAALLARRQAQEQAATQLREHEEARLQAEQETGPVRNRITDVRLAAQAAELLAQQFCDRLLEVQADLDAVRKQLSSEVSEASLQRELNRWQREINELGTVNPAALDELGRASERKNYLDEQYDDLSQAVATLEDAIRRIDRETRELLQETYNTVTLHFSKLFPLLFGGGQANLVLTGEEILDAGIQIIAQPPGKKNSSIHLLSGGEKALTAIALVFSLFQLNPAPFCMLDEVDAPLDDANTERYCQLLSRMAGQTQFIFISHSKITMNIAQQLIGVTMQEQGVSRVVEVDIADALRLTEAAVA